jgi:lipopolysaccharide transport system permease protein
MFFVGLLGIGIGWVASSLHVYLRDTGQVLGVVMTVWLWITPVMISPKQIPDNYRFLMDWNPMSFVVNAYRAPLLKAEWPEPTQLAIIAAFAIGTFVAGGFFFRHLKRGFVDVL